MPLLRSKKWARRLLGLGLVCLLLGLGGSWYLGGRLLAPSNHAVGVAPKSLGAVEVTIASASGTELAGWWIPREDARGVVVLLHPLHGDRRAMLGRARLCLGAGYETLLIDLSAHGESLAEETTAGFNERFDVAAAVAFVHKQRPGEPVAVIGWSLGGAAALFASPLDIDALVLESVYPTLTEAVRNRIAIRLGPLASVLTPLLTMQLPLRLGISSSDVAPIEHIADAGCPVLVMGGSADEHTPEAETRRLFERAREPKRLVIVPGAPHADLAGLAPELYKKEVLSFLAAHL